MIRCKEPPLGAPHCRMGLIVDRNACALATKWYRTMGLLLDLAHDVSARHSSVVFCERLRHNCVRQRITNGTSAQAPTVLALHQLGGEAHALRAAV